MEADQRHADIIIESMNVREAKGVTSPCEEQITCEDENNTIVLEETEGRKYRELVAQANYLAQDRCDIQLAVKISKGMCTPTKGVVKQTKTSWKISCQNAKSSLDVRVADRTGQSPRLF